MAMTIEQEIEQLVLKCIALDGLKACPKDLAFLEKYGLKNLYFFSLEYAMEGTEYDGSRRVRRKLIRWYLYSTDFPLLRQKYEREGKAELMKCLYLEERYFASYLESTGQRMDY